MGWYPPRCHFHLLSSITHHVVAEVGLPCFCLVHFTLTFRSWSHNLVTIVFASDIITTEGAGGTPAGEVGSGLESYV